MKLSPEEQQMAQDIGFDAAFCQAVKDAVARPVERLQGFDEATEDERPVDGLTITVQKDELESLMPAIRAVLPPDYRAYWSERHHSNGLHETDEIGILKGASPYRLIQMRGTDGANYDIFGPDIIGWLEKLAGRCRFILEGASRDWVALRFETLPDDICAFAQEVFEFCPDSVHQGIGLCKEEDDPELYDLAERLCPHDVPRTQREEAAQSGEVLPSQFMRQHLAQLPPETRRQWEEQAQASLQFHGITLDEIWDGADEGPSEQMGIKLLAATLTRSKYLFLWWD